MFQSSRFWSLVALILFQLVLAAPTPSPQLACELNFPNLKLQGRVTGDGACRYTVKYGQAGRWEDARATTDQTWVIFFHLVFGALCQADERSKHDPTNFPPACPQAVGGPILQQTPEQDEDCLYAVIYAPITVKRGDRLPAFVWYASSSLPGGEGVDRLTVYKGYMVDHTIPEQLLRQA